MGLSLADASNAARTAQRVAPDDASFEALYRRFRPRLVRLLRRHTRDTALAEDLAQETLMRAYANLDRFDYDQPMWPWLKTIATRLSIDHARRNGREVLCEPEAPAASDDLERFEDGLIHQAMKNLTAHQRVAMSLRYLDDWKAADAAGFLGINSVAFEQLLYRARRRLRTEYTRLSEKALAAILLPYRHLRRLIARYSHQARDGAATGPLGTVGIDAATQLTSGVLALITAAAGFSGALPARGPVAALDARSDSFDAFLATHSSDGQATGGGTGPTSGTAMTGEPEDEGIKGGADDVVRRLTDPNDDVHQPEDSRITSVAFGRGSGSDQTVYAIGNANCGTACERVLFRSPDGGATWKRLAADGLRGETLIIPPGGDGQTLFATGPAGLEVSRDAGRSFAPAGVAGAAPTFGSAAISPAFFRDDPTILIGGAQTLSRYRDDTGTVSPYPAVLFGGPLTPVFSPEYPDDPRIFVGGVRIRAQTNEIEAVVHSCTVSVCSEARLEGAHFTPRIRTAGRFDDGETVLAFGSRYLFMSGDGAETFHRVDVPIDGQSLRDVNYSDTGVLFASTWLHNVGKVLISINDGTSWHAARSPLFDEGATTIATSADRVMVALPHAGLACSTDGGATWASRCR